MVNNLLDMTMNIDNHFSNMMNSASYFIKSGDRKSAMAFGGDIVSFFDNTKSYFQKAVNPLIMILGVLLVAYGAFCIYKAIFGDGRETKTYWGKAFLAIVFGGFFLFSGWKGMEQVGSVTKDTVNQLAK